MVLKPSRGMTRSAISAASGSTGNDAGGDGRHEPGAGVSGSRSMATVCEPDESVGGLGCSVCLPHRTTAAPPVVMLHQMVEGDDPRAFLQVFWDTAEACRWPEDEWELWLLPLLSF